MTTNQLHLFVGFLIDGILIGFVFDIFRILRKSFKHKNIIIYIQDILFWIITGVILLYSAFILNDGQFRNFMYLGAIVGFFIYLFTLSKAFIKISVSIIAFLKKIVSLILKFLLIPIKKIILKPFRFLVINIRKMSKIKNNWK